MLFILMNSFKYMSMEVLKEKIAPITLNKK